METNSTKIGITTQTTLLEHQNSRNHGTRVEEKVDQPKLITTASAHITAPLQINTPLGGRLHQFWRVWQSLGVKEEVINILRDGLKWTFMKEPQMRNTPWNAQANMKREKEKIMRTVIQTLLQKDAIEVVNNTTTPGHYSILFLRKKTSGEYRPIIDLSELNLLIENHSFKMESSRSIHSVMKINQWACSIDLTDAYYHIPIHHSFKKFLRFAMMGETYQFKALPFRLAIAPRIFTMIMLEMAKTLR